MMLKRGIAIFLCSNRSGRPVPRLTPYGDRGGPSAATWTAGWVSAATCWGASGLPERQTAFSAGR
ncbi:hypothetical protein GCM10010335_53600 [Streptomyces galbus]|nr:hypothetical protein GCM10010335_53600 [Streptomyces galbus]